ARIFSRNTENQKWQLQHQGIWFNAQIGDQWQKSNSVGVYPNSDKYWRVEFNGAAKDRIKPALRFEWEPIQLQIITNNKPPYKLAITSGANNSYNRAQIFNQILTASAPPTWIRADLIQLNVQPEALIAAHKAIDWKQWLFWVALMLAVGVLLTFSLKLFKQLNVKTTH
ncbi:MAG: DUF3999 family protein, partial [Moraxellaceae bacterium]